MLTVEQIKEKVERQKLEKLEKRKEEVRKGLEETITTWIVEPSTYVLRKDSYTTFEVEIVKEMEEELIQAGYKLSYKEIALFRETFRE